MIFKLFFQGHSKSNVKKPYQHSSVSFQTEIHWCSLTHWLLNKLFHCGNLKLLSLILQASHNSLCLSNPCFCASVVVCFYQTFKDLKVWMVMNVLNLNEKKINQFFLERQSYYIWLSRVISSLGSLRPPPSSHLAVIIHNSFDWEQQINFVVFFLSSVLVSIGRLSYFLLLLNQNCCCNDHIWVCCSSLAPCSFENTV